MRTCIKHPIRLDEKEMPGQELNQRVLHSVTPSNYATQILIISTVYKKFSDIYQDTSVSVVGSF